MPARRTHVAGAAAGEGREPNNSARWWWWCRDDDDDDTYVSATAMKPAGRNCASAVSAAAPIAAMKNAIDAPSISS